MGGGACRTAFAPAQRSNGDCIADSQCPAIASGTTLTIDPGITVQTAANRYIYIDGSLIAQGTPGNEITFTTYSGQWYGLMFRSTSSGDLEY